MSKIFLIDKNIITYDDLLHLINKSELLFTYSETELYIINLVRELCGVGSVDSIEDLIEKIKLNNFSIDLFTSGTTGLIKKINHNLNSLTKNIVIKDEFKSVIWGLSYHPSKMASYQVIFQSIFNQSTLVNLFDYNFDQKSLMINNFNVTHISGTPTFYRMLISNGIIFNGVKQITLGGEGCDSNLITKLKINFPNAKIKNIYASTEAASLLISDSDLFSIPEKYKNVIKIKNNLLYIHNTLLGQVDSTSLEGEWFNTMDIVEFVDPNEFRFIGRKNTEINVSGYKVNPFHVENVINSLDYVNLCKIYPKKNSVVGNILCCDLVLNKNITKNMIKNNLLDRLEKYEIPVIFNIVESIEFNENIKINRK
jgi:acyl-CoA synthetase (AMP-forming)/AMP-acid ligase II